MKLLIKKGTTAVIVHIFILDTTKTDGSGLTGLVYDTASLTAYYVRAGAATATAISLASIPTLGTYVAGGFKEFDATNLPGVYELHLPDACCATGAEQCVVMLKSATNMAPLPLEIQLRDNTEKDIYDRIGAPDGASIAADLVTIDSVVDTIAARLTAVRAGYLDNLSAGAVALAATALTNVTWTDVMAGYIDAAISGRAPANEYDTQMGYIPPNLGDVPTAAELIAAHGAGAWTTADVSALAIEANVETHVTNSLDAYDPPTRTEATADKNAILADHTVMKQTSTGAYERDTDSLEAIRDNQSSASSIADAVWDEDLTGHTTSKSAGWFVQKIKAIVDAILGLVA